MLFKYGATALLALTIFSCSNPNQCGHLPDPRFDIIGLQANNTTFTQLSDNGISPVETTPLADQATVDPDYYLLELSASVASLMSAHQNNGFFDKFNFSLFPKAHACSTVPPYTDEKIGLLNITSSRNFSEQLPQGASLNSVFNVEYHDTNLFFAENMNRTQKLTLQEYILLSPNSGKLMQLTFNQLPIESGDHQFNIEYRHTNGELFLVSTLVVNF